MIRTLVAVKVTLIRLGLISLLSAADDIEVVAELQHGDDVVPAARSLHPDVAVLGAALPGTDGFTVARALRASVPSCRTLIMSDRRGTGGARRAAAAGAAGFISVDADVGFLTEAVRRAASGLKVIDPDLAFDALRTRENPLTLREREALRLAADGATAEEIAVRLSLSPGTVRNYLSRATSKTGARTRVDAIRIAESSGWL